MLELAVRLAQRVASGHRLSPAEAAISNIMWIGTQVSPNGFDGWLAYTSCERIRDTLDAIAEVGCGEVAEVVRTALQVPGLEPQSMTDTERERLLAGMSEEDRGRLRRKGIDLTRLNNATAARA
jgi:hypothetical protein